MRHLEWSDSWRQKGEGGCQGAGRQGTGSECLVGLEFLCEMMKQFWRRAAAMGVRHSNKLHTYKWLSGKRYVTRMLPQ